VALGRGIEAWVNRRKYSQFFIVESGTSKGRKSLENKLLIVGSLSIQIKDTSTQVLDLSCTGQAEKRWFGH
jgi:hypothetical protein